MATATPTDAQVGLLLANEHRTAVLERIAREGFTPDAVDALREAIAQRRAALAAAIAEERRS